LFRVFTQGSFLFLLDLLTDHEYKTRNLLGINDCAFVFMESSFLATLGSMIQSLWDCGKSPWHGRDFTLIARPTGIVSPDISHSRLGLEYTC
jgi:hypothetical protein